MIPLLQARIAPDASGRVARALESGYINVGENVAAFEAALARYLGAPEVLAVNSCTSALVLALRLALRTQTRRKRVYTTPMTFVATTTAICQVGAEPIWSDVERGSCQLSAALGGTLVDAIMAVAWAGWLPDLAALRAAADARKIPLILDAAQAFGATFQGKPLHAWADYTCYSFSPTKHLTSVTPETRVMVRAGGRVSLPKIGDLDDSIVGAECPAFDRRTGSVRWREISGFICHHIEDTVRTIVLEKGRTVRVTPSHSLFTYRESSGFCSIPAADLRAGDWIAAPRRLPAGRGVREIDLVEVLGSGDIVVKGDRIRLGRPGEGGHAGKWIDRALRITPEFCRVLGYFAAEGCFQRHRGGSRHVIFSFGAHEENTHVADLIHCLRSTFPVYAASKWRTKRPDTGMKVAFGSSLICRVLDCLGCGSGALNKRVPDIIWDADDGCKLAFIEALLNGDGHRRIVNDEMEHENLVTISEELAVGLHCLLLTLGIQSSLSTQHSGRPGHSRRYDCTIINRRAFGRQENAKEHCVPSEFVHGPGRRAKARVRLSRIERDGMECPPQLLRDICLLRIRAIKDEAYSGDVFDFSVREDENFVGGFGAVCLHNTGDGGALLCRDPEKAALARKLSWFGMRRQTEGRERVPSDQDIRAWGYKFNMNELAAAVGLANLETVGPALVQSRRVADYYRDRLPVCWEMGLDVVPSPWFYTIFVDSPDRFIAHMADRGVSCTQPHRRNDEYPFAQSGPRACLPNTDFAQAHYVALPVGWWLRDCGDAERVVDAVRNYSGSVL